ncbi:hypothetical protein K2173_018630 [Erythroxylum novogranatense]|uniref:Ycf15 n=1 Tax=Erythroxylum novogranatense TaxID=1862640 RepID=A0AAV8T1W8_9ROSI|nr:hypothetical protein K2173_018630 [Erythroxylum novogranatense]
MHLIPWENTTGLAENDSILEYPQHKRSNFQVFWSRRHQTTKRSGLGNLRWGTFRAWKNHNHAGIIC